jgi:hypothetical protein
MYRIDNSDIANIKIVTTSPINIGEVVGIWVSKEAIDDNCRFLFQKHMTDKWYESSDLGRYCNHSFNPNVDVSFKDNMLLLVSNNFIELNTEILVDYRMITKFTGFLPNLSFTHK